VNLMDALRRSIEADAGSKPKIAKPSGKRAAPESAPARKRAGKK